jgi:uncharacterized membrane protein
MVSFLGFFITKEWTVGIKLASAEMAFETILYYIHEKGWHKIRSNHGNTN